MTSICPTDAARRVAADCGETDRDGWRRHRGTVQQAAQNLARSGEIHILRKRKMGDSATMDGLIRLRLSRPVSKTSEEF